VGEGGPPPDLEEEQLASTTSAASQGEACFIAVEDTACYDGRRAMSVDRRPSFASKFPASPELDALVEAFARGDYAHVRAEAPKLEKSSEDGAVRTAARTLAERTRPDPLSVGLLVLTGLLLLVLTGWWVVHGRAPHQATPTTSPVEKVGR
jgi:hypothetical protein